MIALNPLELRNYPGISFMRAETKPPNIMSPLARIFNKEHHYLVNTTKKKLLHKGRLQEIGP